MLDDLKRSGLTAKDANLLGVKLLTPDETKAKFGVRRRSYVIPYFSVTGDQIEFARSRFLDERPRFGQKSQRYAQRKKTRPYLYLPPYFSWDVVAADSRFPLFITEGEKKAAKGCREGLATIGLGGLWSYQSNKHGFDLIPDFHGFTWEGREVRLVGDSDVRDHEHNLKALFRLANKLTKLGARVYLVVLPAIEGFKKVGLDDYLVCKEVIDLVKFVNSNEKLLTPAEQLAYLNYPYTDAGNAEVIALLHGYDLRYDHKRGTWMQWAGNWWELDEKGRVIVVAKETARARQKAALETEDADQKKRILRFAIGSENRQRIEAALSLARNEEPLATAYGGDGWDTDPWLMGVANGVIDLRTGELRPGTPADRISKHTDVPYNPKARSPTWERVLREVLVTETGRPDRELRDFFWRAAGYSLTGDVREHCLFICHGGGSNGKSTLVEALRSILGDYGWNTPFSTLQWKPNETSSNDVAALAGTRLVTASEASVDARINEALVKKLTGGDRITARLLYREFFQFDPTQKFWLCVNDLPRVHDSSYGFWRRVRVIPFHRQFAPGEADRSLPARLRDEYPGILAWAVRGCREWQQRGLEPPQAVRGATEEYQEVSDTLAPFIEEMCCVETGCKATPQELYDTYQRWYAYKKYPPRYQLSQRRFGELLFKKFEKRKIQGKTYYKGISLKIKAD